MMQTTCEIFLRCDPPRYYDDRQVITRDLCASEEATQLNSTRRVPTERYVVELEQGAC